MIVSARTRPFYRLAVCLLILTLIINTTAPRKTEAILPVVALTATQALVIGTLAVATGIGITKPDVLNAVAQDMYRKNKEMFDTAVNATVAAGGTAVAITAAMWDWLKDYANRDAKAIPGTTLQTATDTPIYTGVNDWIAGKAFSAAALQYCPQGTAGNNYNATDGNLNTWIDMSSNRYEICQAAKWNYPPDSTKTVVVKAVAITAAWENIVAGNNTDMVMRFYSGSPGDSGTNTASDLIIPATSMDGRLIVLPTPTTQYTNMIQIGKKTSFPTQTPLQTLHVKEVKVYTDVTSSTASQTVVGVGDMTFNDGWTNTQELEDKSVTLPIPTTGATSLQTALTAVTGTTAASLTYTDVATGQPYTPPTPSTNGANILQGFIVQFLDMLRAMIEFTLRLVTFLVTLQTLPIKDFGQYSTTFDWFKQLRLGGIPIYDSVMSLAALGISFALYRVVRRVAS